MNPKKIILIEDNLVNQMVFKDILESSGYQIVCFESAEDALSAASSLHPDLILLDIQLPGIDGLTAARLLRAQPLIQEVPIIALTAHALPDDREKSLIAGCSGYIAKPIRIKEFRSVIEKYLNCETEMSLEP
jgi:CheY-like chemotaxis protein